MLCALLAALAMTGCSQARSLPPTQRVASALARTAGGPPAHVAVIVMENEEFGNVIDSISAPYINALAVRYAMATEMYAVGHPSLPNYLALTGGSTFGIHSDCTDCTVQATNLVDQLSAAHISWKAYMEDLPTPCFTGPDSGEYAKKHDPFVYYTDVARNPERCARVVPLSQLSADERSGRLPRFIWISPNLCNDMHDCGVATGDAFLSRLVPPLLGVLGHNGVLFLEWDEGWSNDGCCALASGGHVVTIVAGPGARRGAFMATPVDHYSVLQTIEDVFGLPRLRGAACACTPSLRPLLASRG